MEDIGFQLQQHQAISPCCHLGIMPNLPIVQSYFRVLANLSAHPNIQFSKVVHPNLSMPLHEHMNKWESPLHMDGYYVVGVAAIPYHGYGSIIIIVFKEEKTYLMSITYNQQ